MPFTALCATFFAVITVLFATFLAVRAGPAWALWTLPMQMPSARNIENNAFMVPKYRCSDAICVYPQVNWRIGSCLERIVRDNTNSPFFKE